VPKISAGLLLYRRQGRSVEVFLVHPGGPLWAKKDLGAWSIPKGEVPADIDLLAHARREFREETGTEIDGKFRPLAPIRQAGGKIVHAWAVEGNCDAAQVHSNTFTIEWPPRSGRVQEYPEVDRAAWLDLAAARAKINPAQAALLTELEALVTPSDDGAPGRSMRRASPASPASARSARRTASAHPRPPK
jgi:predicted NUDIX family NTP pyrophosphohydrolase